MILLICMVGAALFAKTSVLILAVVGAVYASVLVSMFAKPEKSIEFTFQTDRLLWPPYNGELCLTMASS